MYYSSCQPGYQLVQQGYPGYPIQMVQLVQSGYPGYANQIVQQSNPNQPVQPVFNPNQMIQPIFNHGQPVQQSNPNQIVQLTPQLPAQPVVHSNNGDINLLEAINNKNDILNEFFNRQQTNMVKFNLKNFYKSLPIDNLRTILNFKAVPIEGTKDELIKLIIESKPKLTSTLNMKKGKITMDKYSFILLSESYNISDILINSDLADKVFNSKQTNEIKEVFDKYFNTLTCDEIRSILKIKKLPVSGVKKVILEKVKTETNKYELLTYLNGNVMIDNSIINFHEEDSDDDSALLTKKNYPEEIEGKLEIKSRAIIEPEEIEGKPKVEPIHVTHAKRIPIPKRNKDLMWMNYGKEKMKCPVCDTTDLNFSNFEAGHIIPYSKGGSNEVINLRPICGSCNKSMSNTHMIDWCKLNFPNCELLKRTELIYLCKNNLELEALEMLDLPDIDTEQCLDLACQNNMTKVAIKLLNYPGFNSISHSSIINCIKHNNIELINLILDKRRYDRSMLLGALPKLGGELKTRVEKLLN